MSDRERRLEGAFQVAFQALARISRGNPKCRSNVRGRLSATEARRAADEGIEQAMRALAGQDVHEVDAGRKIGLAPEGRDTASDVLRATNWLPPRPTHDSEDA